MISGSNGNLVVAVIKLIPFRIVKFGMTAKWLLKKTFEYRNVFLTTTIKQKRGFKSSLFNSGNTKFVFDSESSASFARRACLF